CESRGSRTVLREAGGETPSAYSPGSLHKSRAQKRTLPARAPVAGGHPAQSLQNGDFGRRPSPSRPDGGKDFRRTNQRRPVRGLGGDMPRCHTLARGDRRHGQSPRSQGAAGRATHQGGGRGVAISPSLQSRYEPHRKSLLQAQSLPAQTRRTDRRGSDPRPRILRRNLQALRMYKLLQILRLSGRYRMIGFCSRGRFAAPHDLRRGRAPHSRRLARVLTKIGVGFGDRVATLAWNDFRHLELYYGVSGMGAVCHTVNPRLAADDIAFIMSDAQDCAIFADPSFAGLLAEIAPSVNSFIRSVVLLTDEAGMPDVALAPGMRLYCYETLMAEADEDYAWPEFDENSASALCYTSGTTGRPKGVLYS